MAEGKVRQKAGYLNGRMMTSGLEIDATTTKNLVSGRGRSRVRSLMERGNLISQSQRTRSRARLDFGSYPLILGAVKRTEMSGARALLGINGMDCRHETVLCSMRAQILTSSVNSERSARDRLKTASLPPTRREPASESSTWKKSGDDLRDVGVENRKAKPAREKEKKKRYVT